MDANSSVVELKEFLISIIGNAPYGVIALGIDGRMTMVNGLAADHLFQSKQANDLLGQNLMDFIVHVPLLSEKLSEMQALGRQDFDLNVVQIDSHFYSVKGRKIVDGMAIVTSDITETVTNEKIIKSLNNELEEKVKSRTKQLEVANQNLNAFASSISHDLKNPITSLSGYAQVLNDSKENLNVGQAMCVEKLLDITERMSAMVDNMLHLSRIGEKKLSLSENDLNAMIAEIVDTLKMNDEYQLVAVEVEENCSVFADHHLLHIVLTNLISNAWKYANREKKPIIQIGMSAEDTFFVKDNGIGFDAKQSKQIFDSFKRADSAKDFKGTGIGLDTVSRIIKQHKGKIWAESELGKGATFFVTFPTAKKQASKRRKSKVVTMSKTAS